MSPAPSLSVVVPTLDEAHRLPDLLADLRPLDAEIIVADGGSTDATVEVARAAGARVFRTSPGRGRQLREGAAEASGAWLLFVHADCRMARDAVEALKDFLSAADPRDFAHFDFELDGRDFIHRFIEFGQELRERWLGLVYGDQGLVVSRRLYDDVDGYPDWPIMEDVGIVRRLERKGRRVALGASLVTSDRRYREEGGIRRWLQNVALMLLFRLGADPHRLARWYRPRRRRPPEHPGGSDSPQTRRAVCVFVKDPVPGKVKTRLAEGIGEERAVEVYRTLGRATVDGLRGGDYRLIVHGDPPDPEALASIARWLGPDGLEVHPQVEGDLGTRMAAAAHAALAEADAVVLVGSDIPGIDRAVVSDAFSRLASNDVVIGPATDGGYYLIGLSRPSPELFSDIRWSTATVLADTLERIEAAGLSVALLDAKSDVDTVADLTPALRATMAGEA